jgi:predicted molibdopterin-dependent oxidoreductase YjgC
VNNAISHGYRGATSKIITMGDSPLERSDCVFCGECIQACPVGALVEKQSRYRIRPWEARHVRTTCPYCGVGCQLDLHIKDNKIVKVTGVEGALPNLGRLCVKGRFGFGFVSSPKRLTTPMIRENGELRDASWDEALNLVATKIKETKEKSGADAIAAVCSARATNETLYLMQKLFRTAVGTNNLWSPFAATGMSNSIADLQEAPVLLLIGSDVTADNPVAGTFIKQAAKNGAKLIVIDSHPTTISQFATVHLRTKKGTESVLVNGIIRRLLERSSREGSDELKKIAEYYPLNKVTSITGLAPDSIEDAIAILDTEKTAMLVYGSSVAGWVKDFTRLQQVLGNLDRDCGGVNYLGELCNSQGAVDMGFMPGFVDIYKSLTGPGIPRRTRHSRKRNNQARRCCSARGGVVRG